jgi:bifunctional non-homologous end joining protein LigD
LTREGEALYSRNGYDWSKRIPDLAQAFSKMPCGSAVLDGELVLPDRRGRLDFVSLQRRRGPVSDELVVFVSDLLHRDGADLRQLSLEVRKNRIARLVDRAESPCMHLVGTFDDGQELLDSRELLGLEGIVSKRRDAAYWSGECRDWRKIKTASWKAANVERWRL